MARILGFRFFKWWVAATLLAGGSAAVASGPWTEEDMGSAYESTYITASTWAADNLSIAKYVYPGGLTYNEFGNGSWSGFTSLYANNLVLQGQWGIDSVSMYPGHVAVVSVAGTGGSYSYWVRQKNSGTWGNWTALGGNWGGSNCTAIDVPCILSAAPRILSWGASHMAVFVKGTTGNLYINTWNGSSWGGYVNLHGDIVAPAMPVSWAPGHIAVFAIGRNNVLWYRQLLNGSWTGWINLGVTVTSMPEAVSTGVGSLIVFARVGSTLQYRKYSAGSWGAWQSLGVDISNFKLVKTSNGMINIVSVEANGSLHHREFDGTSLISDTIVKTSGVYASAGQLDAVSWGGNRIDVYALDSSQTSLRHFYAQ